MEVRRKNIDFFKKVQEEREKMNNYSTDWEQVRIQAAIAAMQGILANQSYVVVKDEVIIRESVSLADVLVKELKGE